MDKDDLPLSLGKVQYNTEELIVRKSSGLTEKSLNYDLRTAFEDNISIIFLPSQVEANIEPPELDKR